MSTYRMVNGQVALDMGLGEFLVKPRGGAGIGNASPVAQQVAFQAQPRFSAFRPIRRGVGAVFNTSMLPGMQSEFDEVPISKKPCDCSSRPHTNAGQCCRAVDTTSIPGQTLYLDCCMPASGGGVIEKKQTVYCSTKTISDDPLDAPKVTVNTTTIDTDKPPTQSQLNNACSKFGPSTTGSTKPPTAATPSDKKKLVSTCFWDCANKPNADLIACLTNCRESASAVVATMDSGGIQGARRAVRRGIFGGRR